jgi:hypothetical protein
MAARLPPADQFSFLSLDLAGTARAALSFFGEPRKRT